MQAWFKFMFLYSAVAPAAYGGKLAVDQHPWITDPRGDVLRS